MKKWWKPVAPEDLAACSEAAEGWLHSAVGAALLEAERAVLDQLLPGIFGYRLVQLGLSPSLSLYDCSEAGHRFVVSPAGEPEDAAESHAYLCSEASELALAAESADILLLHHVLDFDPDPHAVLREAVRVLISGGTAVVVSFNPWSLLGARRALHREGFPWSGHFIAPTRLRDWMNLLDLHPQSLDFGFYRPPVNHAGLRDRLGWMERAGERLRLPLGGFYIMTARKHPVGMTPLRPRRARRGLMLPGIRPTFGETRLDANRRNLL